MTTEPAHAVVNVPNLALAAPTAMNLLSMAIEKGVDVASLEKLQAMAERAQDREAVREFAMALGGFQGHAPQIEKKRVAEFTGRNGVTTRYTYCSLDDICAAVRPALLEWGLSYTWDSTIEGGSLTVVCTVRHLSGHEVTASMTLPVANPSSMNDQQKVGSAMSYGRRYTLTAALGLTSADPDDDGHAAGAASSNPISDRQLAELTQEINSRDIDIAKFLRAIGAESLEAIDAGSYSGVLATARRKAKVAP